MRLNWVDKSRFSSGRSGLSVDEMSANLHGNFLTQRFAIRSGGCKPISSCFCWLYVNAKAVRGPNRVALWLKRDGLGVSQAKAHLRSFAPADLRSGVQHLDLKLAPSELLNRFLVVFPPFLHLLVAHSLLVSATLDMARVQNPAYIGRHN